jgi:ECF sigma factor
VIARASIKRPIVMTDVTRILSAIEQGEPQAVEQLLPLVYEERRKLAAHKLASDSQTKVEYGV